MYVGEVWLGTSEVIWHMRMHACLIDVVSWERVQCGIDLMVGLERARAAHTHCSVQEFV